MIVRPVEGGVMQKAPGQSGWTFEKARTLEELKRERAARLADYARAHEADLLEMRWEVPDAAAARTLEDAGVQVPGAPPTTVTVQLDRKRIAALIERGLRPVLPEPKPAAAAAESNAERLLAEAVGQPPNETNTVSVWLDGFESGSLNPTYWGFAYDDNGFSGTDTWGVRACNARSGSRALHCAAVGGLPCNNYDTDMTAWLRSKTFAMNGYTTYNFQFFVATQVEFGYDFFAWFYTTDGFQWFQGYCPNPGWFECDDNYTYRPIGVIFDNSNGFASSFSFELDFYSDFSNAIGYGFGAMVDDFSIAGNPRSDLTYATSNAITASRTTTGITTPLYAGQNAYADFTFRNANVGSTAGNFTVYFFLDGAFLTSRNYTTLVGGSSITAADIPVNVPASGVGWHTLRMDIDYWNDVVESNEGNNIYSQQFYWEAAPAPDLVIDAVNLTPASPTTNDNVTYQVILRNAGTLATPADVHVTFFRDRATAPTTSTPYDDRRILSPMAPGSTQTVYFFASSTMPATILSWIYLDQPNLNAESNESNNLTSRSLTFTQAYVIVTGRFVYDDSLAGPDRPVRCAKVTLWEFDGGSDDQLGVAATDANGNFSFGPLANNDADDPSRGRLDVYARLEAATEPSCGSGVVAVTISDAADAVYTMTTTTANDLANGTVNIGTTKPVATNATLKTAMHLYEVTRTGYEFARSMNATAGVTTPIPPIRIRWWIGNPNTTGYAPASNPRTIHLNGQADLALARPDVWDDCAVLHEYGHHLSNTFNFTSDRVWNTGHTLTSEMTEPSGAPSPEGAWDEGWATYFACTVLNTSIWSNHGQSADPVPVRNYYYLDLETGAGQNYINGVTYNLNDDGASFEGCVASLLWDLADAPGDDQPPSVGSCSDQVSNPNGVWDSIVDHQTPRLHSIYGFYRVYQPRYAPAIPNPMAAKQLGFTFCEHGITPGQCADIRFVRKEASLCPAGDFSSVIANVYLNGDCTGLDVSNTSLVLQGVKNAGNSAPGTLVYNEAPGVIFGENTSVLTQASYIAAERWAVLGFDRARGCGDVVYDLFANGNYQFDEAITFKIRSPDQDDHVIGFVDSYDQDLIVSQNGTTNFCGDMNGSGSVTTLDLSVFLSHRTHMPANSRAVTAPSGGYYYMGSGVNITWTPASGTDARVTINLLRSGTFVARLFTDLIDDGSQMWTIPLTTEVGSDYGIEVIYTAGPYTAGDWDLVTRTSPVQFGIYGGGGGGGGCPIAEVLTPEGWKTENSILGRSLTGAFATDACRLTKTPDDTSGRLEVRIRENEREYTTLDQARLLVVDHAPGASPYVVDGVPHVSRAHPALRVTTQDGRDITADVSAADGMWFEGAPGDVLDVQVESSRLGGGFQVAEIRDIIKESDPRPEPIPVPVEPGKDIASADGMRTASPDRPARAWADESPDAHALETLGYVVQVPDGAGGWREVARRYPREGLSQTTAPIERADHFRIVFKSRHGLDFVGAMPANDESFQSAVETPQSARHARFGDVVAKLDRTDGTTIQIAPQDTVTLAFDLPELRIGLERSVFLLTHGVYTSIAPVVPAPKEDALPLAFDLAQNEPNPFSAVTTLHFDLPQARHVRLEMFDARGRLVRVLADEAFDAGSHTIVWDRRDDGGKHVASGVYLYRITAGTFQARKKMVVLP